MYTVKSASKIDSFQDHCVYEQNWLLSRPSETYTVENSIKLTPFKTITLELYSVQNSMEEPSIVSSENTVKVTFGLISGPSMRNQEDTGQRMQGRSHLLSSYAP